MLDPSSTSSTPPPTTLVQGQDPAQKWTNNFLLHATGICYQRSQVTLASILDGTSTTFLIGEKYINSSHYGDGIDPGDEGTMYDGDDIELLRWTGIDGAVSSGTGSSTRTNLPRQDASTPVQFCHRAMVRQRPRRLIQHVVLRWLGTFDQLFDRRRDVPPPWEPQRRPARRWQPVLTSPALLPGYRSLPCGGITALPAAPCPDSGGR